MLSEKIVVSLVRYVAKMSEKYLQSAELTHYSRSVVERKNERERKRGKEGDGENKGRERERGRTTTGTSLFCKRERSRQGKTVKLYSYFTDSYLLNKLVLFIIKMFLFPLQSSFSFRNDLMKCGIPI